MRCSTLNQQKHDLKQKNMKQINQIIFGAQFSSNIILTGHSYRFFGWQGFRKEISMAGRRVNSEESV